MTVGGTGAYSNAGKIVIGMTANSRGTLNITNGGTVITPGVDFGAGSGNLLNFDRDDSYSFTPPINGNGGVSKNGSGTVTLTVNNGYTRGTTVNGGLCVPLVSPTMPTTRSRRTMAALLFLGEAIPLEIMGPM